MSTSFYITRKLDSEDIERCKQLLDSQDILKLQYLLPKPIEICHRACGWQLLWFSHDFKYFDKNIDSLKNFIRENIITDECGNRYSFEEFISEIEPSLYHGLNYEKYFEDPEHSSERFSFDSKVGYGANRYGEFYIDGLRFTNN